MFAGLSKNFVLLIVFVFCPMMGNAAKKVNSAMIRFPLTTNLELQIECPRSLDWKKKFAVPRKCSVQIENGKPILFIEKMTEKEVESGDFSTLSGSHRIMIEWLSSVKSIDELKNFMLQQKDSQFPRYNTTEIQEKLSLIGTSEKIGQIFDLAKGNFDPREPSSPDIFVLNPKNPGAIWMKDAGHLQFPWETAVLLSK